MRKHGPKIRSDGAGGCCLSRIATFGSLSSGLLLAGETSGASVGAVYQGRKVPRRMGSWSAGVISAALLLVVTEKREHVSGSVRACDIDWLSSGRSRTNGAGGLRSASDGTWFTGGPRS
jgi:hypothetical protein